MTPISAEILALTQELNFETGVTTNYLVLRIQGGAIVRAPVGDDDAVKIVASASLEGPPVTAASSAPSYIGPQTPRQEAPQEQQDPDVGASSDARVFGGDYQPGATDKPSYDYEEPPPPPPVVTPPRARGEKIERPPIRSVPRDEMGYPVANRNGVDVNAHFGGQNADEDGVGSV